MALRNVKYTKVRGSKYHFNIPIPVSIQHLYPAGTPGKVKSIFDGTTRTADPEEAEKLVRTQKVVMDRQQDEVRRKNEQDKIAKTLAPEDARLLSEYGGVDGVLQAIRDNRIAVAFSIGDVDHDAPEVEGGLDTPPHEVAGGGPIVPNTPAQRVDADIERQQEAAQISVLTAETRRLKSIAKELGEDVSAPPKWLDEGGRGDM